MKKAKAQDVKEEKTLIGDIWGVLREAIDKHPNHRFVWAEVVEVSHALEKIVEECQKAELKCFAEEMSLSVVGYLCEENTSSNHDDEVKVINEAVNILKTGYWTEYNSDKDWEELINLSKSLSNSFSARLYNFSVHVFTSVLGYLSNISEQRRLSA